MSKYFVKQFNKKNKCAFCPKSKMYGYSLCKKHITEARVQWQKWSVKRRKDKLCCYCHRKSFKGWLRCKTHTMYNRKVCAAWTKAHPEYRFKQYAKTLALLDSGYCRCKAHNPLPEGFRRCDPCRDQQKVYRNNSKSNQKECR